MDHMSTLGIVATVLGAFISLAGVGFGFTKWLFVRYQKSIDDAFGKVETSFNRFDHRMEQMQGELTRAAVDQRAEMRRLEDRLTQIERDLPKEYLRREEYRERHENLQRMVQQILANQSKMMGARHENTE